MANVSIITVLGSGVHLHFNDDRAPNSVEAATDGVISRHINSRLENLDGVRRFVIVFEDLSWKVDVGQGQHDLYRPPLQSVAKQRIAVTAQAGGQVIARTSVDSGEQAAEWIDGTLRKHGSALAGDVFGPRKETP